MNPDSAYRQLKKFLAEAGLPNIRFHDLRHTFSTHALASGVDAKTLCDRTGYLRKRDTAGQAGETMENQRRGAGNG